MRSVYCIVVDEGFEMGIDASGAALLIYER